jgi:ribosomal protein S18 acetylase RimI-like enzyme
MPDGNTSSNSLRLARPLLQDFAYIARRMRRDEREQFVAFSGMGAYEPDIVARALSMLQGPTFSLVDERNVPVILGGFHPRRRGVFEAWLAGTDDAWAQHWRTITRECARQLQVLLNTTAHRVEVYSLTSRVHAHAWYERIGLQLEATLRRYCADGSDVFVFARTRP